MGFGTCEAELTVVSLVNRSLITWRLFAKLSQVSSVRSDSWHIHFFIHFPRHRVTSKITSNIVLLNVHYRCKWLPSELHWFITSIIVACSRKIGEIKLSAAGGNKSSLSSSVGDYVEIMSNDIMNEFSHIKYYTSFPFEMGSNVESFSRLFRDGRFHDCRYRESVFRNMIYKNLFFGGRNVFDISESGGEEKYSALHVVCVTSKWGEMHARRCLVVM